MEQPSPTSTGKTNNRLKRETHQLALGGLALVLFAAALGSRTYLAGASLVWLTTALIGWHARNLLENEIDVLPGMNAGDSYCAQAWH